MAGIVEFPFMAASVFASVITGAYHINAWSNDVREGRVGFVAQLGQQVKDALSVVQGVLQGPFKGIAQGMLGEEEWQNASQMLTNIQTAAESGELPNTIQVRRVQQFIELLIPDLAPQYEVAVAVQATGICVGHEVTLRQVHKRLTRWLGESSDGSCEIELADVERVSRRLFDGSPAAAMGNDGFVRRNAADLSGLDLLTPVRSTPKFNPNTLTSDLANIIIELCVHLDGNTDPRGFGELSILEQFASTDRFSGVFDALATGFVASLKEKHIPLRVVRELSKEQKRHIVWSIERQVKEYSGRTKNPLFINKGMEFNDSFLGKLYNVAAMAAAAHEAVQEGDAAPAPATVDLPRMRARIEEACRRGSADIYLELLQKSLSHVQARELRDEAALLRRGIISLKAAKKAYKAFFHEPPADFFTVRTALQILVAKQQFNQNQNGTIAQAKAIATRWLGDDGFPGQLRMIGEQEARFREALQALVNIDIQIDREISHWPYHVVGVNDMARHREVVDQILEANEGKIQKPIRQTLDQVNALLNTFGDLIDATITAPRTMLDVYTRPSVVAAIAIHILLLASLMSAIFCLGSLHFLTSLALAGGLSIALQMSHRVEGTGHVEAIARPLLSVVSAAFEGIEYLNDELTKVRTQIHQLIQA